MELFQEETKNVQCGILQLVEVVVVVVFYGSIGLVWLVGCLVCYIYTISGSSNVVSSLN